MLLARCRKYMIGRVEDKICDEAFDVGMIARGQLLEKGDPDGNKPNSRLRNMGEYTDAMTANDSDELL
jgi:hypothetical protein